MPQRKKVGAGKRKVGAGKRKVGGRKRQAGKSWGSFWSGVKSAANTVGNVVKDNASTIGKVIKDNQLVSKGLNLAGSVVPYAGTAGAAVSKLGYGRRHRMGGRGQITNEHTKVILV